MSEYEPIILNKTGDRIARCLAKRSAYLSMIAEGRRTDIYNSMSQIASIIRGGTVETNAHIFPIGDQLIVPWKDMDNKNHNTDATAYQLEWDIVHHGLVTLQDGSVVPGMYLMMHKSSNKSIQFSGKQAFYQAITELPAGTYHIGFGVKYNDTFAAGTSGQFTLTKALPAGGRLSLSENNVQAWATAADASPAETVSMTIGSGGTDLGTIASKNTPSKNSLNALDRIINGHNRWATSAIRQYLNARGTNWFKSMEDFDIRPDNYNMHGFVSGFNDDFLNAIKPVKVTTALNRFEGFSDDTEDTFDTFFLPSLEQINATPQLPGAEGEYFEYWRRRLGLSDFAKTGESVAYDGYKISDINGSPNTGFGLRSANHSSVCLRWMVASSGFVPGNWSLAIHGPRFCAVCVIC